MTPDEWQFEEDKLLQLRAEMDRAFGAFSAEIDVGDDAGKRAARPEARAAFDAYRSALSALAAAGGKDWDVRRRLLGLAWRQRRAGRASFAGELVRAALGRV